MNDRYDRTFELRLTKSQHDKLGEKAERAGLTKATLVRAWIDGKDVIERQPVADKELVTEIRKIGGMIKRSFNVLDKLEMGNRSEFYVTMAKEAIHAYQQLIVALDRIPNDR